MYLQKIHIENYRLLTNIDIFLDRVLTLIVGKNNTGKTSVINLIRKVLNEEKTLSIDDYPLECRSRLYDVIEKYWAGEIDQSEVKQQIAETSISFYIDYSEEDDDQPLGSLSPFIIDIDDNNTSARIDAIYTFDELKADEMFSSCKGRYDQLLQARQKDNPGDEGQEGFDRALTAAVVKDSFDKFFYLKVLAVNPSNVEDCQEKPSSLLRKLFTYRTIEAERNLDESENKNDHPLAGMMNRVFNPEEQELESAFSPIISELNRYVDDVGFSAQERIDALMNQIIAGMIHFGYPSAEDLKLKASSNISLKNQIMSNTDLMYTSSDGGESLPSTHNGLGYKNLIKISLILTEFSRAVVANATTIPLLLIEEPEAHMHPQLQSTFVGFVSKFLKESIGAGRHLQTILSSHSSHVANTVDFKQVTHRMLARHQNYPNLFDALGDHFREQDDIHFVFFRDRIEPLYNALVLNDTKLMFDALGAGRRPIETKKQKKQWQAVKRGLEIARQGTIYDVLKAAYDSRLIPIQPEIERLKKLYEAEEPQEYHKTTLARFYAIQYEEVVRAINFFKVDGMYSTDHGVKGEEYDNVLLVMGRGWNLYKFEDILWKEESQLAGNDLKAYIRNRNLFYVCCSRPRKRLAILITVPISDQFRNYLNRVFGTQNVIEYTRFIKW